MEKIEPREPVPPASQLAVLPFLAAVQGFLAASDVVDLRLTIHRVMSREGGEFLQQVSPYLPLAKTVKPTEGRIFPVDKGIMGAAYEHKKLFRTRSFPSDQALQDALSEDLILKDATKAKSWMALPFLGPSGEVVLILFADCNTLNFFADDDRVTQIVAMCEGFCRLHDYLQGFPFTNLQNFPLQKGNPNREGGKAYSVQEQVDIVLPRFQNLTSFNYETAAA